MQTEAQIRHWFKKSGIPATPENLDYEKRVQALEDAGCTRSDAQAIVEAERTAQHGN